MEHLYLLPSNQSIRSNGASGRRERIFQLLEEATFATSGGSLEDRLLAALSWVDLSIRKSHSSSLDAYRKSLELLQVLISTGSTLESLHYRLTSSIRLRRIHHLAVDAAACATREGRVEMALELLEQGRSLLLTQAGRYRTPVDDLEGTLADKFRAISAKMEASALASGRQSVDSSSNPRIQDEVAMYVKRLYFLMPSDKPFPL